MAHCIFHKIELHSDKRGFVLEPFFEAFNQFSPKNVHLAESKPGVVRANHKHLFTREWMYLFGGNATFYYRDKDGNIQHKELSSPNDIVIEIPPGQSHAIKNTGDDTSYLIVMADKKHDSDKPDVEQDHLVET